MMILRLGQGSIGILGKLHVGFPLCSLLLCQTDHDLTTITYFLEGQKRGSDARRWKIFGVPFVKGRLD